MIYVSSQSRKKLLVSEHYLIILIKKDEDVTPIYNIIIK